STKSRTPLLNASFGKRQGVSRELMVLPCLDVPALRSTIEAYVGLPSSEVMDTNC
ncbi:hypothetical protein SK128_009078, partial [Halocaridina rubra]